MNCCWEQKQVSVLVQRHFKSAATKLHRNISFAPTHLNPTSMMQSQDVGPDRYGHLHGHLHGPWAWSRHLD